MNLFDQLVNEALRNQSDLVALRTVVEKELLHHDILREMSSCGLLDNLTFIGDTCLRACYGSNRLSEDLDFTGGKNFKREMLCDLGRVLVQRLEAKYGLDVTVEEPEKETGNVDTWKMRIVTQPARKMLPVQGINIDICALPSYDRRPLMLRNIYQVEMGTSGLILQAESREEILADKMIAFALRPNRLKNRDLWDIAWLKQQGVVLPNDLIEKKILDRQTSVADFLHVLDERAALLEKDSAIGEDFRGEMRRFLPAQIVKQTIENGSFWPFLSDLVRGECENVARILRGESEGYSF
ncbi:MAG: nucleotidyl transferase AbiEii/AbiGii toxin family protein [Desulforhopalus sp.]|nr:nucleotidyl transferase AbiEii/AbiGii toxin family protein [Desulforhopalus sp.]